MSAKELWDRQYLYFQNISSLAFFSTSGLVFSEEMKQKQKLPIDKLETTMDFCLDGNKYRSEVSFLDVARGKKDKAITAYNGQLYQIFQANAASLTVSKSTENMMLLRYNPYMGMNQTLVPFLFAFHSTRDVRLADQPSIDTLKKPETWSHLVKDTGEIHQTNMNNRDGVSVTLKKEQEDITRKGIYEIFFATDLGYFPTYYKLTSLGGVLLFEVKILETQKCGSKNIIIPLRIETKECFDDGKPAQSMILEIDPKTLKVNEKISPEIFTIPATKEMLFTNLDQP